MRVILLNTGTELLLGDVQDAHLAFIAREILPLGLRIEERRTVPDSDVIRQTLAELFPRCEILFVTGGLGPTSDDVTREMVADLLGLELRQSSQLLASLQQKLRVRGIKWTSGIARQADVHVGAEVLSNQNGSAPGLYLRANINPEIQSPHLFLLPGPPRELQPMFRTFVIPILRTMVPDSALIERRLYKIANKGESLVEEAIGTRVLAIPGVELGYCARPGEVDVRIVGKAKAIEEADAIIRSKLGPSIFSAADESLEEVIVKLLAQRNQTLAVAESCTGGLLADRITNVPGASAVFLAGYVCYANQAKIGMLNVDLQLIEKHGAVSEQVACVLAEHARAGAKSDYALATTGVAGPSGGSLEKPVGTVYVALATSGETIAKKFFFPTDRETFKQIATQAALELLRRRLIAPM
ncbi:MAG TPA: CinA family nicotinamide mononucleotide deamidase-related protein [Candidatus Udaeobacter sp.]|jgi:competence/damage-inducible protein CinA-like protein|nr:CinA family nicotinamide mononucleotide deamidase-related protein [Candidatus Udaeobacter sp.]